MSEKHDHSSVNTDRDRSHNRSQSTLSRILSFLTLDFPSGERCLTDSLLRRQNPESVLKIIGSDSERSGRRAMKGIAHVTLSCEFDAMAVRFLIECVGESVGTIYLNWL